MLLTLDGSDDDKIRPQGLSKQFLPIKVPDLIDLSTSPSEPAKPDEVMTAEEQNEGWSAEDEDMECDAVDEAADVVVDEEWQVMSAQKQSSSLNNLVEFKKLTALSPQKLLRNYLRADFWAFFKKLLRAGLQLEVSYSQGWSVASCSS